MQSQLLEPEGRKAGAAEAAAEWMGGQDDVNVYAPSRAGMLQGHNAAHFPPIISCEHVPVVIP